MRRARAPLRLPTLRRRLPPGPAAPQPAPAPPRQRRADPAPPAQRRPPLTAMTTVSSPWNLATYLSPRVTSDSLRGLKRHITLMLHSAGSAILGRRRRPRGAQLSSAAARSAPGLRQPPRCRRREAHVRPSRREKKRAPSRPPPPPPAFTSSPIWQPWRRRSRRDRPPPLRRAEAGPARGGEG